MMKQGLDTIAYAVRSKDLSLRRECASGGAFSELARLILSEGGIVFGASWDKDKWQVVHEGVERWERISDLQGSKYVQSNIQTAFRDAENALAIGRKVLFSGTPCQVNAFAKFIDTDSRNLLLVDLICHGAPAPKVFERYKKIVQRELGGTITSFSFRKKSNSWMRGRLVITTTGKSINVPYGESPYIKAFSSGLSFGTPCYHCSAKGENRRSDLTIGDFWGIDKLKPELFDDTGMSLVIVHTQKGADALCAISDQVEIQEQDLDAALQFNRSYFESTREPRGRKKFLRHLDDWDMASLVDDCLYGPPWLRKCKKAAQVVKARIRGVVQ